MADNLALSIETDHHWTWLKMRARDERTATENVKCWCFTRPHVWTEALSSMVKNWVDRKIRVSPILFHQLSACNWRARRRTKWLSCSAACTALWFLVPYLHCCLFFSVSALSAALCCTLASCLRDTGYFWNLLFCYTNRFSVYTKPVNPLTETALETAFQTGGGARGEGATPYDGLYREAPPERVPFSGFKYMKGQGFHLLKYIKE